MNRRKATWTFGAVLAAVAGFAIVSRAALITDGLAGRWIFNEPTNITAYDSTTNVNDGTLSGAALFALDPQKGQVLAITGISGQVEIPDSGALEPYSGTISVWVKPTLATTGELVRHQTDFLLRCPTIQFGGYAYAIRLNDNGSLVAVFVNDDPKSCSRSPQTNLMTPPNTVPLNQWTHVAARWDGIGTLSLFVNARLIRKTRYEPNPDHGLSYHGSDPLIIGNPLGSSREFVGDVSDLRIYSRALSDVEINTIYLNQE